MILKVRTIDKRIPSVKFKKKKAICYPSAALESVEPCLETQVFILSGLQAGFSFCLKALLINTDSLRLEVSNKPHIKSQLFCFRSQMACFILTHISSVSE